MDLYEAFALSPGAIVAAVGGGGKTSLVYALARESAERGLAAIVTTTTRFTRPPGGQTPMIIETTEDRLAADVGVALRPGEALVAISGHGEHGRMHGFNAETISGLAALQPGLIAVEADGSAHRPFKAPAPHEPVIPPCTTDVIVCVGLAVLGHNLDDVWVHRSELASELADVPMSSPVTANTVVRVLLHPEGGRKGVPPGARVHALLNNPASPEHEQLAVHIGQRLGLRWVLSRRSCICPRPGRRSRSPRLIDSNCVWRANVSAQAPHNGFHLRQPHDLLRPGRRP